jgi:transcriptional regulator with XRE-family HTH domain
MRRRRSERQYLYRSAEYRDLVARLATSVRALREQNGWTQEEAADRAWMATPLLQRIEAASSNVTLTTLARLCKGFHEDILKLLAPSRAVSPRSPGRPRAARRRRKTKPVRTRVPRA